MTISISAGGDALITRAPFWGTRQLADLTFDSTDIAFCNLEMTTPRRPWVPSSSIQGFALAAPASVLDDLHALGINLLSVANNHATDYSTNGLLDTLAALDKRPLAHSGAGSTLSIARRPGRLSTSSGQVALVAATSSNSRLAAAADPGPSDAGRPGINPLRFRNRYVLAHDHFEAFAATLSGLGMAKTTPGVPFPGVHLAYPDRGIYESARTEGSIWIEGIEFAAGDDDAVETTSDSDDLDALCETVAKAADDAAAVVVSLHCHEGQFGTWNTETPATFVVDAAHRLIDAGADVIFGHGPHTLRGIEVWNGCPIFYSLGNLFFELGTLEALPLQVLEQQGLGRESSPADFLKHVSPRDDAGTYGGIIGKADLWESIVVCCTLDSGRWSDIRLLPIVLRAEDVDSTLGSPRLADPSQAERILQRLDSLSEPFGTRIRIDVTGEGRLSGVLGTHNG